MEDCKGAEIADKQACGGGDVPGCDSKFVKVDNGYAQCKLINGNCLTSGFCSKPKEDLRKVA